MNQELFPAIHELLETLSKVGNDPGLENELLTVLGFMDAHLSEDVSSFQHRGETYYEVDEVIYDKTGKRLGSISNRGSKFGWTADTVVNGEFKSFMSGEGWWSTPGEGNDPSMDAILAAHKVLTEHKA